MDGSEGERLRAYLAAKMGGRYGWVTKLAREARVKRGTLYSWFEGNEPSLGALGDVARYLKVTRAEMVAAMDGELAPTAADPALRQAMLEEFRGVLAAAQAEGVLPKPAKRQSGQPAEKPS